MSCKSLINSKITVGIFLEIDWAVDGIPFVAIKQTTKMMAEAKLCQFNFEPCVALRQ